MGIWSWYEINSEKMKFQHVQDQTTQSFGAQQYECTGFCYCEIERRFSNSPTSISKGTKYIVFAVSSIMALKTAEMYFSDECEKQFLSTEELLQCPKDFVKSEVEECLPITQSKRQEQLLEGKEKREKFENLKETEFTIQPIGMLHTPWKESGDVPRGKKAREEVIKTAGAIIEVFEEYQVGMKGLQINDQIYVYFLFDRISSTNTVQDLGGEKGIFATRAPMRPNRIGMTLVKIEDVRDCLIFIDGIDALDGSPVVDIKIKDAWSRKS